MKRSGWLWVGVMALLTAASACASVSWEKIEAGLSPAEVRGILGEPLMMSVGRGFEVWIYDAQREVVWMRGVVVAWTSRDAALDERGQNLDLRGIGRVEEKAAEEKKKVYVPRSEQNPGYEKVATRRMRWRGF